MQRKVGINRVENIRVPIEQQRQPSGSYHLGRATDLTPDSFDQSFNQRHLTPEDADQHLVFGISPQNRAGARRLDRDARQLGRVVDEGIE